MGFHFLKLEISFIGDYCPKCQLKLIPSVEFYSMYRTSTIIPSSGQQTHPLSFAQELLWAGARSNPSSADRNQSIAIEILGLLDVAALERALSEIVRRHEVLRSSFRENGGVVHAVVNAHDQYVLVTVDLKHLTPGDRYKGVRAAIAREMSTPCDPTVGPLIRTTLFRLNAGRHVLLLLVDHLIFDGWSFGIVVDELRKLYSAFHANLPSPLKDLPIQYGDFAQWERSHFTGALLEELSEYWREQLADLTLTSSTPDSSQVSPASFRPGAYDFEIPRGLTDTVRRFCKIKRISLFTFLLAVYSTVVSRYHNSGETVFLLPIARRELHETQSLIGLIRNLVVFRVPVAKSITVIDLLANIRRGYIGMLQHQDMPFAVLVRDLALPLIPLTFIFQNYPVPSLVLPGITIQSQSIQFGLGPNQLTFLVTDSVPSLKGLLRFDSTRYQYSFIHSLLRDYLRCLLSFVEHPHLSLREIQQSMHPQVPQMSTRV